VRTGGRHNFFKRGSPINPNIFIIHYPGTYTVRVLLVGQCIILFAKERSLVVNAAHSANVETLKRI